MNHLVALTRLCKHYGCDPFLRWYIRQWFLVASDAHCDLYHYGIYDRGCARCADYLAWTEIPTAMWEDYEWTEERTQLILNKLLAMSRYELPAQYFIPFGHIVDPGSKPEGYPLPFEAGVAGELPRYFGSHVYNARGDTGYIVQRDYEQRYSYDDSLAFGGVSGYNFLRRDCKPGAK